ncbi:PH (Pleckstrin Homology) domain-containing protein [Rhodovulum bhavnagarense]|uniref:PH (Pleckstrin Homology) domain-containing protein n=1 Tax=Rhodovulum bhavnagarense TaxID=992286 RepID=A0A4R2RD96_9RHOB|nr:photosynthetic complex putative assembly protein PuhB [Rhodovulum bhavnagarense]TCP59937.1 PH (Pleckstrin Homology) domain-containing protein [Rhodovulum bhavnagarense]
MPHDDLEIEPIRGLPQELPEDEEILWQGAPDWFALARQSLWLDWVVGYFVLLFLWRVYAAAQTMPLAQAVTASSFFLVLGAVVGLLLIITAFAQARATVYTVTTRRVAMRIGAAVTINLNLPYTWIGTANLDLRKSGIGTIAFELIGDHKISYLLCWPHVRPWRMSRTEPAIRCIPDAQKVARIIAEAAETRVSEPKLTRVAEDDTAAAE